MKDRITIIIPTHKRPALIARALDYYAAWGCTIIVCDSSRDASQPCRLPNVHFLHCPELSFDRKLHRAAQQVATPYVCLSADDDFLSAGGLMAGMAFLEKHDDYVSIQGHYVEFGWNGNGLDIRPCYSSMVGFHIHDAEPASRIVRTMNPFMHHVYSVHRSSVLRNSLAIAPDYNLPPLAEFSTAIGGMIFGKHRMLPVFWMARDVGRYSGPGDNEHNQLTVIDPETFLATADGRSYRMRFAEAYSAHVGESVEKGGVVFDQAFSAYLSFMSNRRRGSVVGGRDRIRRIVRRMAPEAVLRWRRRLMRRGEPPAQRPLLGGYPWSDPDADKEWLAMKEVIVKHGRIDAVENKWTP